MSDLSWLNPTPHAIAVYASQPLSPVATQHSLPSGRYSLLGPDFHRLDRTSFAWRTHSITSSAPLSVPKIKFDNNGDEVRVYPHNLVHALGSQRNWLTWSGFRDCYPLGTAVSICAGSPSRNHAARRERDSRMIVQTS